MDTILIGVYACQRCEKSYTVNDEWGPCTPDFCHACYAHLCSLYVSIPYPETEH